MDEELEKLRRTIHNLVQIIRYMESEIRKTTPNVMSLIAEQMERDIHPDDPTVFPLDVSDAKSLVPHLLSDFSNEPSAESSEEL